MCCIFKVFPCSLLCSPAEPSPSPSPPQQTAAQKKSRKSLNCSSDYWPRCGACSNSNSGSTSLPHAATVASLHAISRQNSSSAAIAPQQHVSTVNVNVNVIKLDMSEAAPIAAPAVAAPPAPPAPPSATQWTLLCSGSGVDRRQQPTVAVIRPRVIPLAANSLVLLGDCDLQETRVR